MNRSPAADSPDPRSAREKAIQSAFIQTLRNHSVPSDWMECQVLRGSTGSGRHGLHVHFIVTRGGPSLLPHVGQFENTFIRNLEKLHMDARKWVLGLAWVLKDSPEAPVDSTWTVEPADTRLSAHA